MKTIANRGDYLNAVTDYAREWSNEVVITDGVRTETYTSCAIKITTPFSQDDLSMGQSFTKELDLTIKEPERTLVYNLATIKVYSKLKVGENFVTVQMGEYFPSEVTTNDDYFSLNIKAYDTMGKLQEKYVPNTATIYRWSCASKLYYVENGTLKSVNSFSSLPSIRTGGDLTFVNNSELTAWVYAKSNGTWVGRGLYDDTVNKLEPNDTLTVSCDEYIVSFDDDYVGGITVNGQDLAPMTYFGIIKDISTQYGFSTAGTTNRTEIDTLYEGTCAEMLGWVAGVEGKNAIFNDNGNLVFRWYTEATQDGGRWLDFPITWAELSGRTWRSVSAMIKISRTEQKERGANLNEGEFTIASITSGTEENPLTVGEGKGISFENPYMTASRLTTIGNRELGKKTAVGTVNTFGNPLLEVGDIVGVIDKQGDIHDFFISKMEWNLTGGCSCIITAIGNADAEIEFSNVSPMEKKLTKVKSVLQGVVERFSNLINSLVGYYTITEENGVPTGWTIKDDLNNPQNMIKCSLGGLGISSNGGQTYQTAMTGEGIVADSITTGTMLADRIKGGTLELGGLDNQDGILTMLNASNTQIGKWDKDGIEVTKGKVNLVADSYNDKTKLSISQGNYTNKMSPYEIELAGSSFKSLYGITGVSLEYGSYKAYMTSSGGFQVQGGGKTSEMRADQVTINTGSTVGSQALYVVGAGYATGGFSGGSARALKSNIKPYKENAIDKINEIDICSFTLKEDKTKAKKVGFIADDTDELFATKDHNAIDYNNCIGMLLKAVQELSTQVDELTKEVEELRGGSNVPD